MTRDVFNETAIMVIFLNSDDSVFDENASFSPIRIDRYSCQKTW